MTTIEQSPCTREVRVQDGNRWKSYVARFTSEGVYMREKRKRTWYGPVSYGLILLKGVQSMALATVAEKAHAGPARRKRISRSLV